MDPSLTYGLVSMGAGVIILLIRYTFKSKCSDVSLCYGLITIHREIEQEIEEQKMEKNDSLKNIYNI